MIWHWPVHKNLGSLWYSFPCIIYQHGLFQAGCSNFVMSMVQQCPKELGSHAGMMEWVIRNKVLYQSYSSFGIQLHVSLSTYAFCNLYFCQSLFFSFLKRYPRFYCEIRTFNLLHAEVSYIIDIACHWTCFPILPVLATFCKAQTLIFFHFPTPNFCRTVQSNLCSPFFADPYQGTYVHQRRALITWLKYAISPYFGIVWVLFCNI